MWPESANQQVFEKGGSVASTERCKTWESWECSIKGAGCKLRSIKRMESCARSIESVWRTTSESQGRRVKSVWLVTWKKVKSVTSKAFCKQLDKVKGSNYGMWPVTWEKVTGAASGESGQFLDFLEKVKSVASRPCGGGLRKSKAPHEEQLATRESEERSIKSMWSVTWEVLRES